MSCSKYTHVYDVFPERAAQPLLIASYDIFVTLVLQPFVETQLEQVSACHSQLTFGQRLTPFSTVPNKRGSSFAAEPPEYRTARIFIFLVGEEEKRRLWLFVRLRGVYPGGR